MQNLHSVTVQSVSYWRGRARVANSNRGLRARSYRWKFICFSCDAVRKNVNDANELMWKSKNFRRKHDVERLNSIRFDERTKDHRNILHFSRCIFLFHTSITFTLHLRLSRFCSFHPVYHGRMNVLVLVDPDEWAVSFESGRTQIPRSNPSIALFWNSTFRKREN